MKNLDVFSKRILIAAVSIAIVFSSASLLIYSVQNANASPVETKKHFLPEGVDLYPMGISNGETYWVEYSSNEWHFYKRPLSDFKQE